jgi:hypothetical protein
MNVSPEVFFLGTLVLLWLAVVFGSRLRVWRADQVAGEEELLKILQGAALTLLALLLGFMFSMAASRYERRVDLVVDEADAIGTMWMLTSTLDEPVRTQEQQLMRQYVPVRMEFLSSGTNTRLMWQDVEKTAELQSRMSAAVSGYASDHRDPVTAQFLAALSNSSDRAEERTAAYENRIPMVAWLLLLFMSVVACMMVGVTASALSKTLRWVLPVIIAGVLMLTDDLDSPRHGLIATPHQSMDRVAELVESAPPQGQ